MNTAEPTSSAFDPRAAAPDAPRSWAAALAAGGMLAVGAMLAGCINVTAPAEPIVIELNINIKQEVLYRLVDSAEKNIESNPEIF